MQLWPDQSSCMRGAPRGQARHVTDRRCLRTNLVSFMDELDQLVDSAPARVSEAASLEQLKDIEANIVGRSSSLAEMRRGLGQLPPDERPAMGVRLNDVTTRLQKLVNERRSVLEREAEDRLLDDDRVDVSIRSESIREGTAHLLTSTIEEVVDIFTAIGYEIADGPEVETGFNNFDALNTPKDHPARAESDTLYVEYGDPADEMLLRTATSPMQVRYLLQHEPPAYVLVPGRVFRSDDLDPTHSPVFHQIEGLAVDESISFTDLKGTLEYFVREFLGERVRTTLIPHFFPFTEPSAEMHVSCFVCDGSGCRVCGNSGWIELLGCGMVDPNVLAAVDYDADQLSGFAFGVGVERLAMVRHRITHIRHFFENDLRVLRQFV